MAKNLSTQIIEAKTQVGILAQENIELRNKIARLENKTGKLDPSNPLKNFDELPDSAHVRAPIVALLYACSICTVWRKSKLGLIPKPRLLSDRIAAWNVGELRQSLQGK